MINLNHKYALLEDGTIEPLFYEFNGEPRDAYQDEEGKFYLDHDRWKNRNLVVYYHHRIIATSDDEEELKNKENKNE